MCTLPHEISFSFKKNTADLLNGNVRILVHKNQRYSSDLLRRPDLGQDNAFQKKFALFIISVILSIIFSTIRKGSEKRDKL